jgi:hypothetical protein
MKEWTLPWLELIPRRRSSLDAADGISLPVTSQNEQNQQCHSLPFSIQLHMLGSTVAVELVKQV